MCAHLHFLQAADEGLISVIVIAFGMIFTE